MEKFSIAVGICVLIPVDPIKGGEVEAYIISASLDLEIVIYTRVNDN